MMCGALNPAALRGMPPPFRIRTCRKEELDIWKAMPFDDADTAEAYRGYMTNFFQDVYAGEGDSFFEKCLFVCDADDKPIATCFVWKAYNRVNTLHWFKVLKPYEGRGIGRALLTAVLQDLQPEDYPVYLHTQPASYRAIKLYADFGFVVLTDPVVGSRRNDVEACLPILERFMPPENFAKLRFAQAPKDFLEAVHSSEIHEF
ncbi:GNAT family N-acetyltransferase [Paenibacillus antri]|uniref:GNAT family N-acetyltransferase n=2 Tax=Paenibacillus antri TaxID=2582848 RepID=A0A5R9GCD9_9BACL|nr:GNAT family N-acetyltransferase [Paenibacillus antri]